MLAGIAEAKRLGASYADVRFVRSRAQFVSTEDDHVQRVDDSENFGFGVRVIAGGSWGFSGCGVVSEEEMSRAVRQAIEIARASATLRKGEGVVLVPEEVHVDKWSSPCVKNPFEVSVADKVGIMLKCAGKILAVKGIKKATSFMQFNAVSRQIATSEGTFVETSYVNSASSLQATAVGNGDAQTRYYAPPPQSRGYESIEDGRLEDNAERIARQAVEKINAPTCSAGQKDLVLDPDHLALTIHESVGHATELDRVLGMEESLAGRSFATIEKLGDFRYGSPIVNFVANNTLTGGLASTGYDDDAVACQCWDIIRDGILSGYITNREVAQAIGATRSTGGNRADGWWSIPIIRQPNLCLMPGKEKITPEELISDVKDGVYIEGTGSFSIDQMRLNFQFGGDAFWEIRNGKRTRMLKNVTYQSITPEFWGSCDAICDERFWRQYGILDCGKGDPSQRAQMTHGAAPARFRNVNVGGVARE
jgi:TldD protein